MSKSEAYNMDNVPRIIDIYLRERYREGLSINTIKSYSYDLTLFFRFFLMARNDLRKLEEVGPGMIMREVDEELIKAVTRSDIKNFDYFLLNDLNSSKETRARRLTALRKFFEYMEFEERIISDNPASHVKQPKKEKKAKKMPTLEECLTLLHTTEKHSRFKERDLCIITFALNLGLRREELASIDLKDITSGNKILIHGKGGKQRILELNATCIDALESYLQVRVTPVEEDEDALFISQKHCRMTGNAIWRMISNMVRLSGLDPQITTHKLRNAFAIQIYKTSGDIVSLKELMGHESIQTTNIYVQAGNEKFSTMLKENPFNMVEEQTDIF